MLLKGKESGGMAEPVPENCSCYVARVYPREDCFEVCDGIYTIQCQFQTECLRELLATQPLTLNIIGLIGKKLNLIAAEVKLDETTGDAVVAIERCSVATTNGDESENWDRVVPPYLLPISHELRNLKSYRFHLRFVQDCKCKKTTPLLAPWRLEEIR